MPNLGDIKTARELGKRDRSDKYIWRECPNCKRQYWKAVAEIPKSVTGGRCLKCCGRGRRAPWIWKGGRVKNLQGYIQIHILPDDPFYPMGRKSGRSEYHRYVMEHRLVIAKNLGRLLTKKDVVHHLNGIRDDNRFGNLALTTANSHPTKTLISQMRRRIRALEQLHFNLR